MPLAGRIAADDDTKFATSVLHFLKMIAVVAVTAIATIVTVPVDEDAAGIGCPVPTAAIAAAVDRELVETEVTASIQVKTGQQRW